tara:strand:- start:304 stop:546 length:243 start_codon:yes stop_codon:yes gene_type:complete
MKNEVKEEIKNIISDILNLTFDKEDNEITSKNYDKWDSIAHINIILSIEEKFQIVFKEEEILESMSLNLLFERVKNKIEK